jgi:hypothetical protein
MQHQCSTETCNNPAQSLTLPATNGKCAVLVGTRYNAAAQALVVEKEGREQQLLTVQGMFQKAQELVAKMRDLNVFLISSVQQVSKRGELAGACFFAFFFERQKQQEHAVF